MILFYAIRIHFGSWLTLIALSLLGAITGDEKFRGFFESPALKIGIIMLFLSWLGSWMCLWIYSWVMLLRSWKTRTSGENARLCLILFFFNFAAAYYFYWKRFEIDPEII